MVALPKGRTPGQGDPCLAKGVAILGSFGSLGVASGLWHGG